MCLPTPAFPTRNPPLLPQISGHGNFGSLDDDPAAAMRYTECRLRPLSCDALLADLDMDTVDFMPTFDASQVGVGGKAAGKGGGNGVKLATGRRGGEKWAARHMGDSGQPSGWMQMRGGVGARLGAGRLGHDGHLAQV